AMNAGTQSAFTRKALCSGEVVRSSKYREEDSRPLSPRLACCGVVGARRTPQHAQGAPFRVESRGTATMKAFATTVLGVFAFVAAMGVAGAGATPPQKCTSSKIRETGKKTDRKLKCWSKEVMRPGR